MFLDEFEKTSTDVHKSLLLIFDEGFYHDRRAQDRNQVDLSKIIWVLASNLGETIIQKHWADHLEGKPDHHNLLLASFDLLVHQLERNFYNTLGAPLTGRLSAIIPFLPFSYEERAITTYKFMRKLFNETRKRVSQIWSNHYPLWRVSGAMRVSRPPNLTTRSHADSEICLDLH